MHPPFRQHTPGEETLIRQSENRAIAMRVHPPCRQVAAATRAPIFRQRACSAARSLAVASLAVVGAVHAASNVVEYDRDAAGNIVAIRRANTAPSTIAGFAPTSGPSGTVVTITGDGFAVTAIRNAVAPGVATIAGLTPTAGTCALALDAR